MASSFEPIEIKLDYLQIFLESKGLITTTPTKNNAAGVISHLPLGFHYLLTNESPKLLLVVEPEFNNDDTTKNSREGNKQTIVMEKWREEYSLVCKKIHDFLVETLELHSHDTKYPDIAMAVKEAIQKQIICPYFFNSSQQQQQQQSDTVTQDWKSYKLLSEMTFFDAVNILTAMEESGPDTSSKSIFGKYKHPVLAEYESILVTDFYLEVYVPHTTQLLYHAMKYEIPSYARKITDLEQKLKCYERKKVKLQGIGSGISKDIHAQCDNFFLSRELQEDIMASISSSAGETVLDETVNNAIELLTTDEYLKHYRELLHELRDTSHNVLVDAMTYYHEFCAFSEQYSYEESNEESDPYHKIKVLENKTDSIKLPLLHQILLQQDENHTSDIDNLKLLKELEQLLFFLKQRKEDMKMRDNKSKIQIMALSSSTSSDVKIMELPSIPEDKLTDQIGCVSHILKNYLKGQNILAQIHILKTQPKLKSYFIQNLSQKLLFLRKMQHQISNIVHQKDEIQKNLNDMHQTLDILTSRFLHIKKDLEKNLQQSEFLATKERSVCIITSEEVGAILRKVH